MDHPAEFAKLDLVLGDFQRELHQAKKDESIITELMHKSVKRTYYTVTRRELTGILNKNVITFSTEHNPIETHLVYSTIFQTIPALRVKKEYQDQIQISWTHNLCHNIFLNGKLKFGNENIQRLKS